MPWSLSEVQAVIKLVRKPFSNLRFWTASAFCVMIFCTEPRIAFAQADLSAFLKQAQFAISSGKTVSTVTFQTTVKWSAGSTLESGTVQLQSGADGSTSENWNVTDAPRQILQTSFSDIRFCTLMDSKGKTIPLTDNNCLRNIPWFAPWMAVQSVSTGLSTVLDQTVVTDITAGMKRVRFLPSFGNLSVMPDNARQNLQNVQQALAADVLYDLGTSLPARLEYNEILDNTTANVKPISIVYSDYRLDAGLMIPHHIQRFVQRNLQADIQVISVTSE